MTEEHHDIPEWYMPDEEVILANEHEKKEIEEEGELDEPLCPYCGSSYMEEDDGYYIHAYVRKSGDILKIGVICVGEDDKRHLNGFQDASTGDIQVW